MEINEEKTIKVNGEDYFLVDQFSRLIDRKEETIRVLIRKGNRSRKLKAIKLGDRHLIQADELFNFPFIIGGRPYGKGDFIERFYIEDGKLMKAEEIIEKCN